MKSPFFFLNILIELRVKIVKNNQFNNFKKAEKAFILEKINPHY